MSPLRFWSRVRSRYSRESARLLCRRPFVIDSGIPFISFTFDDFPRSALITGGAILQRFGLNGTYYASFGLMGKQAPTGRIFERDDLNVLFKQGHELGCHTFDHCNAWETEPCLFEKSIVKNQHALNDLVPGASFQTLSYPISVPRAQTKNRVAKYFVCCRCGGQTFNAGKVDLNYLSAYFLEKSRNDPEKVKKLIEQNRRVRGWLIFATHDICQNPSPFGCTPEFFEDIVKCAVDSDAQIVPVIQALEALHTLRSTLRQQSPA
jgi:peptidoglycan/xylan/chitin deacetylase (PgdA/CDA1 family)